MYAAEMVTDQGKTWLAQAGKLIDWYSRLSQTWQALLDELYRRKAANGLGELPVVQHRVYIEKTSKGD
jgi:hypothetical protein